MGNSSMVFVLTGPILLLRTMMCGRCSSSLEADSLLPRMIVQLMERGLEMDPWEEFDTIEGKWRWSVTQAIEQSTTFLPSPSHSIGM